MKPSTTEPESSSVKRAPALIGIVTLAAILFLWLTTRPATPPAVDSGGEAANSPTLGSNVTAPPFQSASVSQTNAVALPSQSDPVGDGKSEAIIRRWAHNELEVQRMLAENDRVYRRQLVTLKETAAAVVEQHRLTGEPIRELSLPGLDGQEFRFDVAQSDLNPSGQQGTFAGHLAGRLDSVVTLAFKNGREAFTIISPSDNLYLFGDPHDPGDLIVKSVDISKYPVGLADDVVNPPVHDNEKSNENQR